MINHQRNTLFGLISLSLTGCASIQAEEKWVDLFDVKNLSGWTSGVLCTDFVDVMNKEGYIALQHHGERGSGPSFPQHPHRGDREVRQALLP